MSDDIAVLLREQRNIENIADIYGPQYIMYRDLAVLPFIPRFISSMTRIKHLSFCTILDQDVGSFYNLLESHAATIETLAWHMGDQNWEARRLRPDRREQFLKHFEDQGIDWKKIISLPALRQLSITLSSGLDNPVSIVLLSNIFDFSNFSGPGRSLLSFGSLVRFTGHPGTQLALKSLSITKTGKIHELAEGLQSFTGLEELMLLYGAGVQTLLPGIKHHSATLRKLYWRSTIPYWTQDRDHTGYLLNNDQMAEFQSFPELRELAVSVEDNVRASPGVSVYLHRATDLNSVR